MDFLDYSACEPLCRYRNMLAMVIELWRFVALSDIGGWWRAHVMVYLFLSSALDFGRIAVGF